MSAIETALKMGKSKIERGKLYLAYSLYWGLVVKLPTPFHKNVIFFTIFLRPIPKFGRSYPHAGLLRPAKIHIKRLAHPKSMYKRWAFLCSPLYRALRYPKGLFTICNGCSTWQRTRDLLFSICLSQSCPARASFTLP